MRYSVRKATVDDKAAAIEIATMFFNESDNAKNVTANPDKIATFFDAAIQLPDEIALLLAYDCEGRIAGYSAPILTRVFSTEPIGDLYQFYVAPEHRATRCARALVEATVAQYDAWGCAMSYSYVASGVGSLTGQAEKNVALFRNLWQKYGYRQSGIIMTREV